MTISPSTGVSGTEVVLRGYTFTPNTKISIKFDDISVATFPPDILAGTTGGFIAMFNVPEVATGSHIVSARDPTGKTATILFTVTGQGPSISVLNPSGSDNVGVGTVLTITGSGFDPNSPVIITIERGILVTTLTSTTTASSGTFTAVVTIPTNTPLGVHTIRAVNNNNAAFATINIISGPQSSINLSSTIVTPSFAETISGSGFAPNRSVTVELDNSIIATGFTTSVGSFIVNFNIPAVVTPGIHSLSQ
jgi:hypothetical protein